MMRIFLVDDDADDRLLFREALEEIDSDVELQTAANGRAALNMLKKREVNIPDLIFLDINMPLMDGWNVLSIIKSEKDLSHIPVIMYSTSSFPEDLTKAGKLNALCFLTKPSDFEDLKHCLKSVVEHLKDNTLESLADDDSKVFIVVNS